jgi:2-octaprenyl-6-methoxyphenol hydroxylase
MIETDIAIVGAGLTGASLACALSGHGLGIALIEAQPIPQDDPPASRAGDTDRAIALALGSQRIFATLGLWDAIAPHAGPIRRIHVSDRGHFGAARLDARDMGVEALGYVVPARALARALLRAASALPEVTIFTPASVQALTVHADRAELGIKTTAGAETINARLVIGADGAASTVRSLVGITATERPYDAVALVARVTTERPHDATAWERFTPHGPIALLPVRDDGMGLVWTLPPADAQRMLEHDAAAFITELQLAFGNRLGRFLGVSGRRIFPLAQMQSSDTYRERLALIGNAAHVVHPVAGQGFNLGLRDVAVLAETITHAAQTGQDIGTLPVLDAYARARKRDHFMVRQLTHGLISVFANDLPWVGPARGLGLAAVDLIPPLKRALLRRTMGLAGRPSRLARGLSI